MKSASLEGVPTAAAVGVGGSTEGSCTDAVSYPAFSSCAQREEKCEGVWKAPGMMAMVRGCAGAAIGLGSLLRGSFKRVDASFFQTMQDRTLK